MGAYVGVATVGVFVVWYLRTSFMGIDLSGDGHTPVTLWQLRHWETCPSWDGFKARPLLWPSQGIPYSLPTRLGRTFAY